MLGKYVNANNKFNEKLVLPAVVIYFIV